MVDNASLNNNSNNNNIILMQQFFYFLEFEDFCLHLHTHNVLADMSFGLLPVFHVKLGRLHLELNPLFNPQGKK